MRLFSWHQKFQVMRSRKTVVWSNSTNSWGLPTVGFESEIMVLLRKMVAR